MNEPLKSLWENAEARYKEVVSKNVGVTILAHYTVGSFAKDDSFVHKCSRFGDVGWRFPENFVFRSEEQILWLAVLNSLYS